MADRQGTRSVLSRFCFLRDDENLRTTLDFMRRNSGKRIWHVAQDAGIPYYRLAGYLSGRKTQRLSQFQVLLLCDYFGIYPELSVKFK